MLNLYVRQAGVRTLPEFTTTSCVNVFREEVKEEAELNELLINA